MARATESDVLILTARDVTRVIRTVGLDELMRRMIRELTVATSELDPEITITQERAGFHYEKPDLGLVEWMPAMELGRTVSIKTVGYHPTNPTQRSIPSVLATTSLYDTGTGALVALVDSTLLTAVRTGAASAVATDILAVPGRSVLGLVGGGAQAVTQAHAIAQVRTIDRIIAYDPDAGVLESLSRRLPIDVPVEIAADARAVLAGADIVCTATTVDIGAGPVVADVAHARHLHLNAVGSDFPGKTELPVGLLRRALVVPDDPGQCRREGECQQLDDDEIGPSLAEIARERDRYLPYRTSLTVFDSTGWSLEDLVAAELVVNEAVRLGIGSRTVLQTLPEDPFSPYEDLLA